MSEMESHRLEERHHEQHATPKFKLRVEHMRILGATYGTVHVVMLRGILSHLVW